jgi:hypothetical protein
VEAVQAQVGLLALAEPAGRGQQLPSEAPLVVTVIVMVVLKLAALVVGKVAVLLSLLA